MALGEGIANAIDAQILRGHVRIRQDEIPSHRY